MMSYLKYVRYLSSAQIRTIGPLLSKLNITNNDSPVFRTCAAKHASLKTIHTFSHLNKRADKAPIESHNINVSNVNDEQIKMKIFAQNGQLDEAAKIYEKLKTERCILLDSVVLILINGYLKVNQLANAKKLIEDFNSYELKSFKTKPHNTMLSIFDKVIADTDQNELNWFIVNLVYPRSAQSVDRRVLKLIINCYLTKYQDLDATFDVFVHFANQFAVTPSIQNLTCELINRDDVERLQEILAISTKLHGRSSSFYNMAFAFVRCNRIDDAKKIFTSIYDETDHGKFMDFIHNLRLRQDDEALNNLLLATKDCVSINIRENIYVALLEVYAYKNDADKLSILCTAMNVENIIPNEKIIQRAMSLVSRSKVQIPHSWLSNSVNNDNSETMLKLHLDHNNLETANEMLYDCLTKGISLERNVLRYCLSRNARNGNIEIFKHLKPKFDQDTKIQLQFYRYECIAYTESNKSHEYLQMITDSMDNQNYDLMTFAPTISERIVEMIEKNPDIYDRVKILATNFGDKGVLKPICIVWTYNFINDTNVAENNLMWEKYLKFHPTIACNQVTKILIKRKEIDKLQAFLNLDMLAKERIAKPDLGKSYSFLFDSFLYRGDYDMIIDELKKIIKILPIKYFKANTITRIKCGPPTFNQQFWNIVNNAQ